MTAQMINLIRLELELDQRDFAKLIGYSIHTVRSWEQSRRKISPRAIRAIRRISK